MTEILDIVNDQDEVIGQAERDEVHKKGFICRMTYVCFYTPNKEVILQKRSLLKKSNPGKLTVTVSGHVAAGETYLEAAIKETREETGLVVSAEDLQFLGAVRSDYIERDTYISNAFRGLFIYKFKGDVDDLLVEEDEGDGFEVISIEELKQRIKTSPDDFIATLSDSLGDAIISEIEVLTR